MKNLFFSLFRFFLGFFLSILLFVLFFFLWDYIEFAKVVSIIKRISVWMLHLGAIAFLLFVMSQFWKRSKAYFWAMLLGFSICILIVLLVKGFSEANKMHMEYEAEYQEFKTIEKVIDCNTVQFMGGFMAELIDVPCRKDEQESIEADKYLKELLVPYINKKEKVMVELNPKRYGLDKIHIYLPYCRWDWKGICQSKAENNDYLKYRDGLYFSLNEHMINKFFLAH